MERAELVKRFGEEIISKLDNEICDFSNRVMNNGQVEFVASVKSENEAGIPVTLSVYYYQDKDAVDAAENLDELDWDVDHYSVF